MSALLATAEGLTAPSSPRWFEGPVAYGAVTALDRRRHAGHGVRVPLSYAWCAQAKAVPINVEEFAVAGLQMPIAFVVDATGRFDAAAVLALNDGKNAFVDSTGQWLPDHYLPAYLRRFPFCSFANTGTDHAQQQMICVHEAALEAGSSTPIISTNGELTPYWKPWAQLIDRFESARARTLGFIAKLDDLKLLVPFDALHIAPDGRRQTLTGLHRVDESRLSALSAGVLRGMLQSGEMRALYMHLISLENLKQMRRSVQ